MSSSPLLPASADPSSPLPPAAPLPLAELHLHLEGTLEPDLLIRLAARNGVPLPTTDVEEWRARYVFADLQAFLDIYYANLAVLRTEEDFHDLASAYLERARRSGLRRVEAFVDPQVHRANGVPLEVVFDGLGAAFDEARAAGLSCDLVVCFLRDQGPEAAEDVFDAVLPFRDRIVGVGLDSAERGHPPGPFARVYARAAAEGLHRVAHAGEEGGPEYVREALDLLGVERIDHGIRAMEDPELVRRLVDEQVPLTVCPLSNVALRAVDSLAVHPLPAMLRAGLKVTVNSDDPAYFGGDVPAVLDALRGLPDLDEADLRAMARHSFEAAFVGDAERSGWLAELDALPPHHEAV